MKITPREIRKISWFATVETRNHPSLLLQEINQDYAQKTVQNLELAQETMKVPKPHRKC